VREREKSRMTSDFMPEHLEERKSAGNTGLGFWRAGACDVY
jgi:hypothetical protein